MADERLFDTRFPLLQSPMAGAQDHRLAAAVGNGGGLGAIPAAMLDPEGLARQIGLYRGLCAQPVNVNFFCHRMPDVGPDVDWRWRDLLHPFFTEFGIASAPPPAVPARLPFADAMLEVVLDLRPEVVSFHFGLPEAALLEGVRRSGALILCSATTVEEARHLAAAGVDAIVAQGIEAGGHRGHFISPDLSLQSPAIDLLKAVRANVDLPVIAAGGLGDPAMIEAAMAAGAAAVQVGTSFLCCEEATTSILHRSAISEQSARGTAITNLFTGRPARSIVNRAIDALGALRDDVPPFPLASGAMTQLRQAAEKRGRDDFTPLWCGTRTTGCASGSATDLTRSLATGFSPQRHR